MRALPQEQIKVYPYSQRRGGKMQKANGFTLIELMIVVAIVAILAMVAYPSYQDSVRKGRRAEARRGLAELQILQERHRTNNTSYATSLTLPTSDYYTFSIKSGSVSSTGYTLEADPKDQQADDTACDPISLQVSATNGVTRTPTGCW